MKATTLLPLFLGTLLCLTACHTKVGRAAQEMMNPTEKPEDGTLLEQFYGKDHFKSYHAKEKQKDISSDLESLDGSPEAYSPSNAAPAKKSAVNPYNTRSKINVTPTKAPSGEQRYSNPYKNRMPAYQSKSPKQESTQHVPYRMNPNEESHESSSDHESSPYQQERSNVQSEDASYLFKNQTHENIIDDIDDRELEIFQA